MSTTTDKDLTSSPDAPLVKAAEKQMNAPTLSTTKTLVEPVPSTSRTTETTIEEKITVKPDVQFKPEPVPSLFISIKDQLALPLLRFPLRNICRPQVSTFYPTTQNLFEVVHYMDTLIAEDQSFTNHSRPWHPFLSSVYFAELVFYQTLRCMLHTRQGTPALRQYATQLITDIPPERLPVPGPLMPMFKSICACQPSTTSGMVTPILPEYFGTITADDPTMATPLFCLPNIPFLIGLTNTLNPDDPDDAPDYDDAESFSQGHTPAINGIIFPDQWDLATRFLLSQPGVTHRPTVPQDVVDTFVEQSSNYGLPALDDATPTNSVQDFMCLHDTTWFDNIIPTFGTYATYFKESGTLGDCSPFGPPTGLISTRFTTLSSQNAQRNQIYNMIEAFPETFPFKFHYDARTYEQSIPQPHQMMALYSAINSRIDYNGMQPIFNIGAHNARSGPYWDANPTNLRIEKCTAFDCIEDLVSTHYFTPK